MDFIKLLRSLDELLYEVMSWLAFYPRTLVRILRHPVAVAQYTRLQMQQPKEQQFTEAISPPLLLILSILLAHTIEMVCSVPLPDQPTRLATTLIGNEEGLLAFRSVSFSLYALLASWWVLKRTRTPIDRDTLREPFFIQSFLTSPFAVIGSIASIMARSQAAWAVACGARDRRGDHALVRAGAGQRVPAHDRKAAWVARCCLPAPSSCSPARCCWSAVT